MDEDLREIIQDVVAHKDAFTCVDFRGQIIDFNTFLSDDTAEDKIEQTLMDISGIYIHNADEAVYLNELYRYIDVYSPWYDYDDLDNNRLYYYSEDSHGRNERWANIDIDKIKMIIEKVR